MAVWIWVLIVIGALAVLALLLWSGTRARSQRLQRRRGEAQGLRQEAAARSRRAEEREAIAKEQVEQASRERLEARQAAERANSVDPDVDSSRP